MPGILDNAHVAGVFINTFSSLGLGIETFLIPGADIDLLMESFQRNKFDLFFAVPPVLQRVVAHPKFPQTDFKSVKFMGAGAAKTTVETQKAISKVLSPGTLCQMVWGMTELTFLATMHRPGIEGPWESIGQPLAGNAVKICDDNEIELGVEQAGEIYVSGMSCQRKGPDGGLTVKRYRSDDNKWILPCQRKGPRGKERRMATDRRRRKTRHKRLRLCDRAQQGKLYMRSQYSTSKNLLTRP